MLSPLFIDTFLLDYHLGHVILLGFRRLASGDRAPEVPEGDRVRLRRLRDDLPGRPYTTMPQTYVLAGIPMILIGALLWTMAGR